MASDYLPRLRVSDLELCVHDRLKIIEQVAMGVLAAILALNAIARSVPSLISTHNPEWQPMGMGAFLASVCCLFSFYLLRPEVRPAVRRLNLGLAVAITGFCAGALTTLVRGAARTGLGQLDLATAGTAPETLVAFGLIGMLLLLSNSRGKAASAAADLFFFLLFLVVLTMTAAHVIESGAMFGVFTVHRTSFPTVASLALLTLIAFLHRTAHGFFSVLLGNGLGSRLARVLCRIMILAPYFREWLRARAVHSSHFPPQYTTAILASTAGAVTVTIALYASWRFNTMESEIQHLSLRDPLTGLYNLRGFQLLAQQGLMLANRAGQPFSVLFVDIDDLKVANDVLGHQAGSELLRDTAKILKSTLRETDVIGRIGGDEFAVAGQFSKFDIEEVAERLRQSTEQHNVAHPRAVPLQFSAGHVTVEASQRDSLGTLLAKADEAMYEEKRRRKSVGREVPVEA